MRSDPAHPRQNRWQHGDPSTQLNRRSLLSGSLAVVPAQRSSSALTPSRSGACDAAAHALFLAAFQRWHQETSTLFALSVTVRPVSPIKTRLHIDCLPSILKINLIHVGRIRTDVTLNDLWIGYASCHDVCAQPCRWGWHNTQRAHDHAKQVYPTQEECWRSEGFEPLLEWINTELATATHVALHPSGGWTAAALIRNGLIIRTGRPVGPECEIYQLPHDERYSP